MDIETFKALGLDKPFDAARSGGGTSVEDYARFLRPAEDDQYSPCPEAHPAPGTPRGEVIRVEGWARSDVYEGTARDIWIYSPQKLSSTTAAAGLMVFQDGAAYVDPAGAVRVPAVLDTMIHAGELPPTVAVFVSPGQRTSPLQGDGDQRSVEYDTLTDAYSRFLITELLPFVESVLGGPLSTDPSRRMVAGISSGGICAFTAAWFRPDSFGLVLSHCGSYTIIRGGHNYPYLVRTTGRKPVRVFLTSGRWDLDHAVGNWPLANREMAAALEYAAYDVRFTFGESGHSLRHGGSIFAESVRWLWGAAKPPAKPGSCHVAGQQADRL